MVHRRSLLGIRRATGDGHYTGGSWHYDWCRRQPPVIVVRGLLLARLVEDASAMTAGVIKGLCGMISNLVVLESLK